MISARQAYEMLVEALSPIHGEDEAASVANIFLEDAYGIDDLDEQSLPLEPSFPMLFTRLSRGEPVQYVIGLADFYSLKFKVNRNVLIPRQDTEVLVHTLIKKFNGQKPSIIEVGIGSGCIAVTLAKFLPGSKIFGIDSHEEIVKLARYNAKKNEVDIHVECIDFIDEKSWAFFPKNPDILVSNPPYIPFSESEMVHQSVRQFEPWDALFVEDEDPLIFYRALGIFGLKKMKKGKLLALEINESKANEVADLFHSMQYTSVDILNDLNEKPRVLLATI